jgi:hypothetical protein
VEGALFAGSAFLAALLLAAGRRRGLVLAAAAAVLANLPWLGYARAHHLRSAVANGDTLTPRHLREVLPFTGHVLHGVLDRWPGADGALGVLLALSVIPAAVLAVRTGHGRAVAFVAAVVALDVLVLVAQYVVSATGPVTDPTARRLLDGLLQVTVYRVALVPAGLLTIGTPLLAGLGLAHRDDRPAAAEPARAGQDPLARPQPSAEAWQDVTSAGWDR